MVKKNNSKIIPKTNINTKTNWGKTIGLIILYLLILYLLFNIVIPLINIKPWTDWWKANGGSNYKQCIDFTSIAYYENFKLYYYIRNLTLPGESASTEPEILFIMNLLKGQAVGIVDKGHVTPQTICESIIPQVKMKYSLKERDIKDDTDIDAYGWPLPSNTSAWKQLIASFGGICWESSEFGTYCANNADNWTKDPDNFLAQYYGIPWDSPLIKAYLTNWTADHSGKLYPSALPALLGGLGEGLSGWYGFLRSFDTGPGGMSYQDIATLLWSDDVPPWIPTGSGSDPSKVCKNPSSYAGSAVAGVGMGIGVLGIAAMIPPPGIGVVAAFIAVGVSVAAYYGSRASKGCQFAGGSTS